MAVDQAQAAQIAKAGRRLHQEAKGHMRSARHHRDRARTLYAELEELQKTCVELGINLDLEAPITNPPGGTSGNRSEGSTSD